MFKPTPGPWYVNSTIEHEPGKPRRAVHNVFNQHGLYAHIAECGNAANARLIAAAPELAALAANFEITGPDGDGLVWLVLHGNGLSGRAMFNLGQHDTFVAKVALMLEQDRRDAIRKATEG